MFSYKNHSDWKVSSLIYISEHHHKEIQNNIISSPSNFWKWLSVMVTIPLLVQCTNDAMIVFWPRNHAISIRICVYVILKIQKHKIMDKRSGWAHNITEVCILARCANEKIVSWWEFLWTGSHYLCDLGALKVLILFWVLNGF